jgi:MFS family permease
MRKSLADYVRVASSSMNVELRGSTQQKSPATGLGKVPLSVWTLGFVSMLMDISSEMIHALLPLYLVTVLGTSTLTVGIIEGIAEATASITKVFSGTLSDWLGRRKFLAAFGYGLAALTKPVFPLAPTVGWLVLARFVDRIGKGIRGARDALIADLTPSDARGASFGLRQALDTVGAFLGSLLAIALMWVTLDNFRAVFWVAVIPAFLSLLLILFAVQDPQRPMDPRRATIPISRSGLGHLPRAYWFVVSVATALTLARFSEAFLILKAQKVGLAVTLVPFVLVLMNVVYALAAYPAGSLSDRSDRATILGIGLLLLIGADAVLGSTGSVLGVALGVALWGLHMAFTQGVLSAFVADTAPQELRGTAYGVFNLATGVACTLRASSRGPCGMRWGHPGLLPPVPALPSWPLLA